MKYATCNFREGSVKSVDGSLEWHEGSPEDAEKFVKKNPGTCALFLPSDLEKKFGYKVGCPTCPEVTREEFETEPAIYGVAFYKASSGYRWE